jgi:hypothetical protein
MANDRLYLTCSGCGKGFMLAKHFGWDPWQTRNPPVGPTFEMRLDTFFEKHWKCMAGEVPDPWKFFLLNEAEQAEFEETGVIASTIPPQDPFALGGG